MMVCGMYQFHDSIFLSFGFLLSKTNNPNAFDSKIEASILWFQEKLFRTSVLEKLENVP